MGRAQPTRSAAEAPAGAAIPRVCRGALLILLDTHAVFWLNRAPEKLSRAAARAIERAAASTGLAISSISLWELALLVEKGRLRLKSTSTRGFLDALLQTPGLNVLEISAEIAVLATQFPAGFPEDPADRIIGATARAHELPLVTKDQPMQDSRLLRTIW